MVILKKIIKNNKRYTRRKLPDSGYSNFVNLRMFKCSDTYLVSLKENWYIMNREYIIVIK
jgi:hypothetical protein